MTSRAHVGGDTKGKQRVLASAYFATLSHSDIVLYLAGIQESITFLPYFSLASAKPS